MVLKSALALAAGVSVGAMTFASGADARGFGGGHFGGGHFGGGFGGHFGGMRHFGGGMRDFHPAFRPEFRPEMHAPRIEEGRHTGEGRRDVEERHDHAGRDHDVDRHHAEHDRADERRDGRRADDSHHDDRRPDDHGAHPDARARADDHRRADERNFDHRDELAQHWNDLRRPVNVGRWDHNGFWNNDWHARNFNCYNCRWGWVGPVFWPFALGDMWSFAWWPYAATAPFWNYNVDYIMGGLFWPNGAYAWPSGGYGATAWTQTDNSYTYARSAHQDIYSAGPADSSDASNSASAPAPGGSVADDSQSASLGTCSGYAPGVTSLPIDRIEASVKPTGNQLADLKALQTASGKAESILGNSCPTSPPLTPVGRLDALQKRLDAMVQGLDLVRGPLAKFDGSLSAEQRKRLDALGGDKGPDAAKLCASQNEEFINVPTQEIIATVDPDEKQKAALDRLDNVSAKAAAMLQATCPAQIPSSTEARLDAMDKRLKATVTAMNEVRPALAGFYDSLSDEQKARFNTMPGH